MVIVDGRQRSLSIGMTFTELAEYMIKKLGCQEAINLDGGGSATMWVLGNVMNSPSQGRERPAGEILDHVGALQNVPQCYSIRLLETKRGYDTLPFGHLVLRGESVCWSHGAHPFTDPSVIPLMK